MTCPACGNDVAFPETQEPPLSVCPNCGRTVVVGDVGARLAVAEDTRHLGVEQQKDLRRFRPA